MKAPLRSNYTHDGPRHTYVGLPDDTLERVDRAVESFNMLHPKHRAKYRVFRDDDDPEEIHSIVLEVSLEVDGNGFYINYMLSPLTLRYASFGPGYLVRFTLGMLAKELDDAVMTECQGKELDYAAESECRSGGPDAAAESEC